MTVEVPGDPGALREEGRQLPGFDHGGLHPALAPPPAPLVPFEIVTKLDARYSPKCPVKLSEKGLKDVWSFHFLASRSETGLSQAVSSTVEASTRGLSRLFGQFRKLDFSHYAA